MFKYTYFSFFILIVGYIQAQAIQSMKVSDFDKVELRGSFEVKLQPNSKESLLFSGNQKDLDQLEIEVKNATLHIGFKRNHRIRSRVQVQLNYKQLEKLRC